MRARAHMRAHEPHSRTHPRARARACVCARSLAQVVDWLVGVHRMPLLIKKI